MLFRSVLSDEQTKETVKKFKQILTEGGAKIIHEDSWGLKKLAYPIQKKSTGFYHLIEFEGEGTLLDKYETEFRRDERIMRFLTVKMDKHHVAFADKFRNKAKKSVAVEA